jgi:hypothetical protein
MVSQLFRNEELSKLESEGRLKAVLHDLGFDVSQFAVEPIVSEKVYTDAPGFYDSENSIQRILDPRIKPGQGVGILLTQGEFDDA